MPAAPALPGGTRGASSGAGGLTMSPAAVAAPCLRLTGTDAFRGV